MPEYYKETCGDFWWLWRFCTIKGKPCGVVVLASPDVKTDGKKNWISPEKYEEDMQGSGHYLTKVDYDKAVRMVFEANI